MPAISKCLHLSPLLNNARQRASCRNDLFGFLLVGNAQQTIINVRHGGHAWVFRRRQGQLISNRMKDAGHFYLFGIGVIPGALVMIISHILFGSQCELQEYPKEGEQPPHYWQFERTPLKQFFARVFSPSDMQYHESWASRFSHWQIRHRWNRIETRVKHLIGERQDYKAYHYHPVTVEWLDLAKRRVASFEQHYYGGFNATTRVE